MNKKSFAAISLGRVAVAAIASVLFVGGISAQTIQSTQTWTPAGPDGGNARSFAADPHDARHLYMGTINSWVYQSLDGGIHWQRLSKLAPNDDLIVDNLLVDASDAKTVYAAVWLLNSSEGGLYVSHDAGIHWTTVPGLGHQSIRSFAQAASDPKILIAGTLTGVFRSEDSGATWQLISPPESKEIHEVESLAIDPKNPDTLYAGTWHLPWKTTDGGKSWHNIKEGVIDDSDVFSIIIDPERPETVYASACSGIYKSTNAGELFHKIQGIPSTARRTRVLMQDPAHHGTVYAGTTEGLYKTTDAGQNWIRMTGPDVIVNDVYVDPQNTEHVLLATDRSGVLSSVDGAKSFAASNTGFSGRKVEALLVDSKNPQTLLAGVVNDKVYGGAFLSKDGGATWDHVGEGLDGRDVYTLAQSGDGRILAGTSHGIFQFDEPTATWKPQSTLLNHGTKQVTVTRHVKVAGRVKIVHETQTEVTNLPSTALDARIYALDLTTPTWIAATSFGLYSSLDSGASWQTVGTLGDGTFVTVASHGETIAAARRDGVIVSKDAGKSWIPVEIPNSITSVRKLAFSGNGWLWLAANQGIYFSKDAGQSWFWMEHTPIRNVYEVAWDASSGRILASSRSSDQIYAIKPEDLSWDYWATGYHIFAVRSTGSGLIAASMYDGVLHEPAKGVATSGH